jgi:predicted transposase/invertase (TIGR01784 family)
MAKSKHDPFFSRSLEHPVIAKDFIKEHIPFYLEGHVNWKDLCRIDRSNTESVLKKLHRDMIYRAPMYKGGNVFFGIEQQSKEDFLMPIRFLRYDANVIEAYLKEGNAHWPLIVNFLLYNGNKAPYPFSSEATHYYKYGDWGSKELFLRFYLIDLTQLSDEEILTHGLCAPMEILLKNSRDGKFELDNSAYQAVFHACVNKVGEDYIISMLEYADSLKDFKIGAKMHKFVEEVFQNKSETIMTYGQMLKREARKEGRREGIQEGIQEGRKEGIQTRNLEIAKNMLQKGYDINVIEEITEISREMIAQLKQME